ncbi:MAG TPA: hypothetical protein VH351_02375 [Bryobacteraceae bacterium]|jgi:hypothetical protein|nr:hypothetical protein [Bryobacteraceae bacterium]
MEQEIEALRAENAAVRDQLKTLVDTVNKLQQRLDGEPANVVRESPPPAQPLTATPFVSQSAISTQPSKPDSTQSPAANGALATTSVQAEAVSAPQTNDERYRDGIVIAQSAEDAKVPFLLKFNINTQLRYLNTLDSNDTFTDHLGVTREVHKRNDITVNRAMFILGGYIFDPRAIYSFTVWTSAGAASIVVAGNIGWRFNKAFNLTAGYTGVPGSRSLVATFPFFTATDRSMADNFFRPGFTQGMWVSGELGKGLNYLAFVGNGLNTLSITANKIDTNLLGSGSLWWEPLGPYGEPGKSRNMYDDYFSTDKVRIRLGTSFTRSRENRFSDLDQSSPENTSIYNSDGVQAFATGAFAPGVTLQDATYKMWAIDGGLKWKGLALNGQYFMRWLNDFVADGPLPLASTFDQGGEFSASYFVKPKKLMPYVRGSWVIGQFGNSYEYGAGLKWHYLPTERLWFNTELFRVERAPYGGAFTPYTPGMTGWVPMLQAVLAF